MGICETDKPSTNLTDITKPEINYPENNQNIIKPELLMGNKPVPMNIANKATKSICKITIKTKRKSFYGTGFFMNITNSKKYLITNYHIISKEVINDDIIIEINNHRKMKLNINNRKIKYFERPKDITIIEIRNNDDIYNDIEFLDYDSNFIQKGYGIYQNVDVFSIEHPLGDKAACASGIITYIKNYEFEHSISTDDGSSGCPIILLNNNINFIQVIGIHKAGKLTKKINCGTFIGEIFNNNIYPNNDNNDNYIISEIYITNEDIKKI